METIAQPALKPLSINLCPAPALSVIAFDNESKYNHQVDSKDNQFACSDYQQTRLARVPLGFCIKLSICPDSLEVNVIQALC